MREAGAAARHEIDVARHVHLPHFYFLHPTAFDFPIDAHARDDGYAHAHLHETLDAFDGGHFDGHIEGGAVPGEELDDAAAKRRFDAVGDEIFLAEFGDIDFAFFCEEMLGVDYEGQLVFEDFGGEELGVAGHERDGAEIEAIVQDFVRDVAGKHAVDANLDSGMQFAELGEGGKEGVDGAFVNAEREFAALEALQFGETFLHFIAEIDQAFRVVLQKSSRICKADGTGATNEKRLAKRVLKLADGEANGGLSAVKALGSARKAALFCHHEKDLKFAEVQGKLLGGSISWNYQM
jgi:hypothetical protein